MFIGCHRSAPKGCLRSVSHPALRGLPMLRKTPNVLDDNAHEIAILKERPA